MSLLDLFKAKEDKSYRIISDIVSNIFYSVNKQMSIAPLSDIKDNSLDKARCRLVLYSMNSGYFSWFIVSRLGAKGKELVFNFHKLLVELIINKDSEVFDKIEELILNKDLLSNIRSKINNTNNNLRLDNRLFRELLLGGYLLNRLMEYHNAVEDKMRTMTNAEKVLDPNLFVDQVAKIFVKDYFNKDHMSNYEFSFEFTLNISMQSFTIFSEEVNRLMI